MGLLASVPRGLVCLAAVSRVAVAVAVVVAVGVAAAAAAAVAVVLVGQAVAARLLERLAQRRTRTMLAGLLAESAVTSRARLQRTCERGCGCVTRELGVSGTRRPLLVTRGTSRRTSIVDSHTINCACLMKRFVTMRPRFR